MSTKFYPLKVENIRQLTPESVEITFEIPESLKDIFQYKSGQHLTLRHFFDGQEIRRSYSLCTAPDENKWSVAVKATSHGIFSNYVNNTLKIGDTIEVMSPMGNFTTHHDHHKNIVFFAAGSGITPVMSHIRHALHHQPETNVMLFFGNKNTASVMFREELDNLKNKFPRRFAIYHIFSQEHTDAPLFSGRIDKEKCLTYSKILFNPKDTDVVMICGPNEMIFTVKDALIEAGIDPHKIQFELFNTENLQSNIPDTESIDADEKRKQSLITVQIDGDVFEYDLEYGGQSILDAGIAAGIDLPYSCKGGVCSTCKAKVTEGEVVMDKNYALEDDEVEAGYALMCQSHPRSPHIYVDFDA